MRNPVSLAERLVPEPVRHRCFEPAVAELARRRRARRRRASTLTRAAIHVWFVASLFALAIECRRLHRASARSVDARPSRGVDPMILHDVKFAVRVLWKSPGFTSAALLTLALGIGATASIFSVVQHVLLRPLPYPDASRVMDVNELHKGKPFAVSAVNLQDWRVRNHSFATLGAYNSATVTLAGDTPERIETVYADADVFAALAVPAALGRTLNADDMRQNSAAVVVISERLWRRRFGADPSAVGRMVTIDGERHEIAGVMRAGFDFPEGTEAWLPLVMTPAALSAAQRGAHYLSVVGRLRDGVTRTAAQADLAEIETDLARRFPRQVAEYSIAVTPLLDELVADVRQPLLVLLAAVLCVLLIACVNVSNLLLARATTRTSEIAVRSALGGARLQIFRQLCIESLVLALLGGSAGVLFGSWALRVLVFISPSDLPRAQGLGLNPVVLLFALALSLGTGLLFGVVPAAFASRADLSAFLKEGRRGSEGSSGRRRLRQLMVAVQVALAVVLLTGAGLALRSFDQLTRVPPGFDPSNVLTFDVQLPSGTYPTFDSDAAFFREYTRRLQARPGIVAAGAVLMPPLARSGFGGTVRFPDRAGSAAEGSMQVRSISPGYLETIRAPLRAGRLFSWSDARRGVGVALVSETAARNYWPGANPIGRQLLIGVNLGVRETQPREIVGIVGDVHVGAIDEDPPPVVYVPQDQYASDEMTMVVRTAGDPMTAAPLVSSVLGGMDRDIAISRVRTLQDLASRAVAGPRFRALLLGIFALISLALAAIGIYGTLAFTVSQRRSEIGLRMALGAHAASIIRMVMREGLGPVCGGLVAGFAGAAVLTRLMRALLFNVSPVDPVTFTVVAAALVLTATAACYLPTRRAVRVDPVSSLRG
jgi:putative ABC transport system permease protein